MKFRNYICTVTEPSCNRDSSDVEFIINKQFLFNRLQIKSLFSQCYPVQIRNNSVLKIVSIVCFFICCLSLPVFGADINVTGKWKLRGGKIEEMIYKIKRSEKKIERNLDAELKFGNEIHCELTGILDLNQAGEILTGTFTVPDFPQMIIHEGKVSSNNIIFDLDFVLQGTKTKTITYEGKINENKMSGFSGIKNYPRNFEWFAFCVEGQMVPKRPQPKQPTVPPQSTFMPQDINRSFQVEIMRPMGMPSKPDPVTVEVYAVPKGFDSSKFNPNQQSIQIEFNTSGEEKIASQVVQTAGYADFKNLHAPLIVHIITKSGMTTAYYVAYTDVPFIVPVVTPP